MQVLKPAQSTQAVPDERGVHGGVAGMELGGQSTSLARTQP